MFHEKIKSRTVKGRERERESEREKERERERDNNNWVNFVFAIQSFLI